MHLRELEEQVESEKLKHNTIEGELRHLAETISSSMVEPSYDSISKAVLCA